MPGGLGPIAVAHDPLAGRAVDRRGDAGRLCRAGRSRAAWPARGVCAAGRWCSEAAATLAVGIWSMHFIRHARRTAAGRRRLSRRADRVLAPRRRHGGGRARCCSPPRTCRGWSGSASAGAAMGAGIASMHLHRYGRARGGDDDGARAGPHRRFRGAGDGGLRRRAVAVLRGASGPDPVGPPPAPWASRSSGMHYITANGPLMRAPARRIPSSTAAAGGGPLAFHTTLSPDGLAITVAIVAFAVSRRLPRDADARRSRLGPAPRPRAADEPARDPVAAASAEPDATADAAPARSAPDAPARDTVPRPAPLARRRPCAQAAPRPHRRCAPAAPLPVVKLPSEGDFVQSSAGETRTTPMCATPATSTSPACPSARSRRRSSAPVPAASTAAHILNLDHVVAVAPGRRQRRRRHGGLPMSRSPCRGAPRRAEAPPSRPSGRRACDRWMRS